MIRKIALTLTLLIIFSTTIRAAEPQRIILETDMGNDVDDPLALDMLYNYQQAGKIDLLLISNNKADRFSVPFIRLMNTFYGHPDIPVATAPAKLLPVQKQSKPSYAQTVVCSRLFAPTDTTASDAVVAYRRILAAQPDASVKIISIGFCSNLSRLLNSPSDEFSPLSGRELVTRKVKLLALMGGNFDGRAMKEFNIRFDVQAARHIFEQWPTQMLVSPWEVGGCIFYRSNELSRLRYATPHPTQMAYECYLPMPYDRECWDQTAVLAAVEKAKHYFGFSQPGRVSVDEAGRTSFTPSPDGRIRLLQVTEAQADKAARRIAEVIGETPAKYAER